jgi:hypothetical protein
VRRLKRVSELFVLFVLFPIAVYLVFVIAFAVSIVGLAAYVGALLAVWLLFAYVVPLGTGIMTPDEILPGSGPDAGARPTSKGSRYARTEDSGRRGSTATRTEPAGRPTSGARDQGLALTPLGDRTPAAAV